LRAAAALREADPPRSLPAYRLETSAASPAGAPETVTLPAGAPLAGAGCDEPEEPDDGCPGAGLDVQAASAAATTTGITAAAARAARRRGGRPVGEVTGSR
jgi:hypothetical protein